MALSNINYAAGQDSMGDVFDKTNNAIDAVNNITADNTLATIVLEIGDWNMDSTSNKSVLHGLSDFKKIRSINVIIRNDLNDQYFDINQSTSSGFTGGGVNGINSSLVTLARIDSGVYDSTDFDSTSYNRGWITITYEI